MSLEYFNELGAQPEYTDEQKAQFNKLDYLIHKTFAQTEDGRELLSLWEDALLLNSTAQPGDDLLSIGINEGQKTFIRNIILTIRKVENE